MKDRKLKTEREAVKQGKNNGTLEGTYGKKIILQVNNY